MIDGIRVDARDNIEPTFRVPAVRIESGYMDLLGHYSNHDLQGSLRRLTGKLAALRASGGPPRRPVACRRRSRRPGWVLKAVVQVLTDQGESMRAKDIHAAVEVLVGESVPRSSVKGALATNVRARRGDWSGWHGGAMYLPRARESITRSPAPRVGAREACEALSLDEGEA
jgi:hypothetical protein